MECRIRRSVNESSDDPVCCRWVLEVREREYQLPIDGDLDGLPDIWEYYHFGNLRQGPNDDPDMDGYTNYEEYRKDTDPNEADEYNNSWNDPSKNNMMTLLILAGLLYLILLIVVIMVIVYYRRSRSDDDME